MYERTEEDGRRDRAIVWHPIILALRQEMIAFYWSSPHATVRDSCALFYARLRKKEQKLPPSEVEPLTWPSKPTLSRWIRTAETFETLSARYGRRIAGRRYRASRDPSKPPLT